MLQCRICSRESPGDSRFCPSCGSAFGPPSEAPTLVSSSYTVPRSSTSWRVTPSSSSFACGRFLPGAQIAGRYRIVALLGSGGMGEVYRADDLTLGQPVALKLLPELFEQDEGRLQRLLSEVRLARQISHANICRVYDVGEADGRHFITMEYIDGEDLASLLRRIGRLPRDKAVEVARQLCAGLAAAHDQGILHRDLKPANVMLDGRGRARITDFGLAVAASDAAGVDLRAGTPAYMSPEQLAGREATVRSDLYSLGLLLYEVFTGQPAFKASTPAEMARMQSESSPASPATLVDGIDPAVERAILRCLQSDPRDRPNSALQVAASLPGGDPLAAALAAGETPSPEMVAAAGEAGALRPSAAWACLAGIAAGMTLLLLTVPATRLVNIVRPGKPPQVLAEKAGEIAAALGYADPPAHTAYGLSPDDDLLNQIEQKDERDERWSRLAERNPSALHFWYRSSPRYMVPFSLSWDNGGTRLDDPPRTISGMITMKLDPEGRLLFFEAIPPERDAAPDPRRAPDWTATLAQAGLDAATLRPVDPILNPLLSCDARAAWQAPARGDPNVVIRYEAGAYRGKPVYFEVLPPWAKPQRTGVTERTFEERAGEYLLVSILVVLLAASALLARRNLRLGRGDRRGAMRLGAFYFLMSMAVWLFRTDHVADAGQELGLLFSGMGTALFLACVYWMLYVALEPLARRMWPEALISWSRLLMGRVRDPRVGRDLVVGCLSGVCIALLGPSGWALNRAVGYPPPQPGGALAGLSGLGDLVASLLQSILQAPGLPFIILFFLVLFRMILRKPWIAVSVVFLLFGTVFALGRRTFTPASLLAPIAVAVLLAILTRFGVFAIMASVLSTFLLSQFPVTTDLTAWYAGFGLCAVALFLALAGYGFHTSLAGQPVIGRALLQE